MTVERKIDEAYNAVTNNLEKAEGVLALILRGTPEDTEAGRNVCRALYGLRDLLSNVRGSCHDLAEELGYRKPEAG